MVADVFHGDGGLLLPAAAVGVSSATATDASLAVAPTVVDSEETSVSSLARTELDSPCSSEGVGESLASAIPLAGVAGGAAPALADVVDSDGGSASATILYSDASDDGTMNDGGGTPNLSEPESVACPASTEGLGFAADLSVLPVAGDSLASSYSYSSGCADDDLWECPHCHQFVVPARRCSYCWSVNSDFEQDPFGI